MSRTSLDEWVSAEFRRAAEERRAEAARVERVLGERRAAAHHDFDEPDGDVVYLCGARAEAWEAEVAARSALVVASADLGIELPHLAWFWEIGASDVAGLERLEAGVAVFRRARAMRGLAHTPSRTVFLNAALTRAQAARTAAHECHHVVYAPVIEAAVAGDLAFSARALADRAGRLLAGDPLAGVARRAHAAAAEARSCDPAHVRRQRREYERAEQELEAGAVEYGERVGRVFDLAPVLMRRVPSVHSFDHVTSVWPSDGVRPGDVARTPKGVYVNVAARGAQWVRA